MKKRLMVLYLTLVFLLTGNPASVAGIARAEGGVLYVTQTGSDDCSTWERACGLQTALTNAKSGDQIWVAQGLYTPGADRIATFQLKSGVQIYGGFKGVELGLKERDFTTYKVYLSGDIGSLGSPYDNTYHVVTASGTDIAATLDGFTVMKGYADSTANNNDRGGGIYNFNGNLTLANIIFYDNYAYLRGGGLFNYFGSPVLSNVIFDSNFTWSGGGGMSNILGNPALNDVTFSDNTASSFGVGAGGLYNEDGSPTLTRVTFSGNSATGSGTYGGGMCSLSGNPLLTDVSFSLNSANNGGGMYIESGHPVLTRITFSNNSAENGGGLKIYIASPTLNGITFNSNTATGSGGGIYIWGGTPSLANVTLVGNVAVSGGGMVNQNSAATLNNVTFRNNTASFEGGGLANGSGALVLSNVAFSGNSAVSGGGGMANGSGNPTLSNITFNANSTPGAGGGMINGNGNLSLKNTTFRGNSANNGGGIYVATKGPTIDNSIFWNNSASGSASGSQVYTSYGAMAPVINDSIVQDGCPVYSTCSGILTTDPLLAALGDYGGLTQTLPLLPGSSAIDAGNDVSCAASDQRGITRPQGAHCDIGAFESRGFSLAKTGGDHQSTFVNTAFPTPLVLSITSTFAEPVNGGVIAFTAPSSGASAIPITSILTITTGSASHTIAANGKAGSYLVTTDTPGANAPVSFSLTNTYRKCYLPLALK